MNKNRFIDMTFSKIGSRNNRYSRDYKRYELDLKLQTRACDYGLLMLR